MTWGEAARLTRLLRVDPSSQTAAAIEGWDYPISHEALAILDLFDLEHVVNSKKRPDPHPLRPWKPPAVAKRRGNAAGRTPDEVKAILREQFGRSVAPILEVVVPQHSDRDSDGNGADGH